MSIERTRQGSYRVRLIIAGVRHEIGIVATEEEARALEDAVLAGAAGGAPTLRKVGGDWLDARARDGVRGIKTERGRWRTHIETAPFADRPPALIGSTEIEAWIRTLRGKSIATPHHAPRPLSRKTIREVVQLLRQCFDYARVAPNPVTLPARELARVQRRAGASAEPWTYLDADEQRAVVACEDIPEPHRALILFAVYAGLRQGEQMNLELRDVHLMDDPPWVHVLWGAPGLPPKNGRARRVFLPMEGAWALAIWLRHLEGKPNEYGLAFPGSAGGRMARGKTPLVISNGCRSKLDLFPVYLAAAGVRRHVRWHDLRHTCASSLIAGWWGRRWTLEEVREHLGHTSIQATLRYAHLGETAYKAAIRSTRG